MKHSLSLAAVPALIPENFTPKEVKAIRKLINYVDAYHDIFGGQRKDETEQEPWIRRMDCILTSVGPRERPLGDRLLKTAGIHKERLRELVIGDICGILIPRPGLSTAEDSEVERVTERWTGIKLGDLEDCARRASRSRGTGVIVIAIGKNKAAFIYEVVRRGLVNHLIVDQDLADRLATC
jgi:DNA-binding transcriptional regulator LsrR (DeoR family)